MGGALAPPPASLGNQPSPTYSRRPCFPRHLPAIPVLCTEDAPARSHRPDERRRRRAGWLPGTRRSPSANVIALVRAEEPSRVLHSSPFPSGALVPCHRSYALCSDLILTRTWQVDSHLLEEMGSGGQGATGRRPDSMPQAMGGRCAMGSQSGHCHPDVPGEVGGVAQVRPQRPEGGLHTATQLLRA